MMTETTTPTTEPVGRLPKGCLACLDCGVPVKLDAGVPIIDMTTQGRPHRPGARAPQLPVAFSRCWACRARELEAERMALGQAVPLTKALGVLAAVGVRVPSDLDADEVEAHVRQLTSLGESIQWCDRYVPWITDDASGVDQCASSPWAHVPERTRRAMRAAVSRLLAERRAVGLPPVAVTPAEARGCLYCGIGHVSVPAREVAAAGGLDAVRAEVWHPVLLPSPAPLGGGGLGGSLRGSLCPACWEAHEDVGRVLGQAGMLRALRVSGTRRDELSAITDDTPRVPGLVGWGSLGDDAEPNAAPWAHLRFGDET